MHLLKTEENLRDESERGQLEAITSNNDPSSSSVRRRPKRGLHLRGERYTATSRDR